MVLSFWRRDRPGASEVVTIVRERTSGRYCRPAAKSTPHDREVSTAISSRPGIIDAAAATQYATWASAAAEERYRSGGQSQSREADCRWRCVRRELRLRRTISAAEWSTQQTDRRRSLRFPGR